MLTEDYHKIATQNNYATTITAFFSKMQKTIMLRVSRDDKEYYIGPIEFIDIDLLALLFSDLVWIRDNRHGL